MVGERVGEAGASLSAIRGKIGQRLDALYQSTVSALKNTGHGDETRGSGITRRRFLRGGLAAAGLLMLDSAGATGNRTGAYAAAEQSGAEHVSSGSYSFLQSCRARVGELASTAFNDKGGERGWNKGDEVVGIPVGREFTITIGNRSFRARINDRGVGEMIRDTGMPDPATRSFEGDVPISQTASQRVGENAVEIPVRDGENGDITVHYVKCSSPAKLWEMVRTDRMRQEALDKVKKDPKAPVPPEDVRPTRRVPGSERNPSARIFSSSRMSLF